MPTSLLLYLLTFEFPFILHLRGVKHKSLFFLVTSKDFSLCQVSFQFLEGKQQPHSTRCAVGALSTAWDWQVIKVGFEQELLLDAQHWVPQLAPEEWRELGVWGRGLAICIWGGGGAWEMLCADRQWGHRRLSGEDWSLRVLVRKRENTEACPAR